MKNKIQLIGVILFLMLITLHPVKRKIWLKNQMK
jgi:hypothetical protein